MAEKLYKCIVTSMLRFLILISLLVCLANSQYRFDCDEKYCSKKGNECPPLNCENGRIVKNATTCGCCHICIKKLKEGEDCITTYHGWNGKVAECGHGLVCKETAESKGKCVPTECLRKMRKYEKEYNNTKYPLTASFGCDYFGNFKPVVCIDDALCFCVDKNGRRIFGTDFAAKNDTMECDCSRDIDGFPREVEAENLPRCLPNGNYDPLQCTADKCFCMESGRYIEDDVVNNTSAIKKLSCYNSDRHEDGRTTKCLKEREQQLKLFKRENVTVIGVDPVHCELDGTYSPLQCKKRRCFCVSRKGKVHEGYENVKKEEGRNICRCLRDKEILKNLKTSSVEKFTQINCDENYTSEVNVMPQYFFEDFMK